MLTLSPLTFRDISFTTIITAVRRLNDVQLLQEIITCMSQHNFSINMKQYDSIINMYLFNHDYDNAMKYVKQAQQSISNPDIYLKSTISKVLSLSTLSKNEQLDLEHEQQLYVKYMNILNNSQTSDQQKEEVKQWLLITCYIQCFSFVFNAAHVVFLSLFFVCLNQYFHVCFVLLFCFIEYSFFITIISTLFS